MTIFPVVIFVTLLGPALAVGCVVLVLQRRRLRDELRDARLHAEGLANALDVWQWRSDTDHRLRELRPPSVAGKPIATDVGVDPASAADIAWTLAIASTRPLAWTQFASIDDTDDESLRRLMQAKEPIDELDVRLIVPAASTSARAGAVSGLYANGISTSRSNATSTPASTRNSLPNTPANAGADAPTGRLRAVALTDAHGRFNGYVGTLRITPPAAVAHPPATSPADERESFAYTVSHDLRAPIRVVEGFTRILKEDYGRLLDRHGLDHLDRVLGAAARMHSMIDALLALSQLSIQPLAREPVDLTQLALSVCDDLRRQSPERQVQLTIAPDLKAEGDPTLLRVMLENLLGNAWKYTARRAEAQIWFGHDPTQPSDTFTVRDNGAGFDMRFNDRLFGAFQRLHSASDFQGTGVGLASVRRIVRRHGGDVWAEAEVERGARFNFSLGKH